MQKYAELPEQKREYYQNMLKIIGSLSRLFSESETPHIDSRVAENLYCKAFKARNVSRADVSVDAVTNKEGIGIKTFQGKGQQKIAEFNKDILSFNSLSGIEKAKKIAELRNKRIEATKRIYGVEELKYHCIIRDKGKILLSEEPMDLIDVRRLKLVKSSPKSLAFKDGKNEYGFNTSKSVLYKRFKRIIVFEEVVEILEDPFNLLDNTLTKHKTEMLQTMHLKHQQIILPLYSIEKGVKVVPKKSGLNQWNAGGRNRGEDEVYIRIPAWIHRKFAGFFPKRETKFNLKLPNGEVISAKVCQQGDKALMSDPNKALGYWILRNVLQQPQGKLLDYKQLQELGIDSVIVRKTGAGEYSIDFAEEGKFEKFEEENNI